jgi:hypothetical protein
VLTKPGRILPDQGHSLHDAAALFPRRQEKACFTQRTLRFLLRPRRAPVPLH